MIKLKKNPKSKKTEAHLKQKLKPKLSAKLSSKLSTKSKVKPKVSPSRKVAPVRRRNKKSGAAVVKIPSAVQEIVTKPVAALIDLAHLEPLVEIGVSSRTSLKQGLKKKTREAYYSLGGVVVGVMFLSLAYLNFSGRTNGESQETHQTQQKQNATSQSQAPFKYKMDYEFKSAAGMSLPQRIVFWSALLEKSHDARDQVIDLVAGKTVPDTAPLVPLQHNCTTFVETVISLARSNSGEEFLNNLLKIRYMSDNHDFEHRNHFPELDWIPNNTRAQILFDSTSQIAQSSGVGLQVEKKIIDRGSWLNAQLSHHSGGRALASFQKSSVEISLPYLKVSDLNRVVASLPSGSVLNLVHPADGIHPVLITHQGFIIREGNQVQFRHALLNHGIRTMDLLSYVRRLSQSQRKGFFWPLIGVNINQIKDSTSESSFRRD